MARAERDAKKPFSSTLKGFSFDEIESVDRSVSVPSAQSRMKEKRNVILESGLTMRPDGEQVRFQKTDTALFTFIITKIHKMDTLFLREPEYR